MRITYADLGVWRAAASTPSKIGEGKGPFSDREFRHFVSHARGSVFEIETQLRLALRLGYISEAETGQVLGHVAGVGRMIGGVIRQSAQQHES